MTRQPPPHILIAGGGVAAVEAVAALRALAGSLPRITLLAPETELAQRPASVATPFGFGAPPALPFAEIQRRAPFDVHRGTLGRVDVEGHIAYDTSGEPLPYDVLLVAVGAVPRPALPGAITFAGAVDAAAVAEALERSARLAFVAPRASGWTLPVYELAMMATTELRDRGRDPEITIVTPEAAPLWLFGPEAGVAISAQLAQRGIAIRTGTPAVEVRPGELALADGSTVAADAVIALPRLEGPAIPGLPSDAFGFIDVDAHGRVRGAQDVYAAGDATSFPLKQGGLATQQADAAAEAIAHSLGAPVRPAPFSPVMRGLLLTGGAPLYLRSTLSAAGEPETTVGRPVRRPASAVSQRALWWPPGKIAGRYLAPLQSTARPPLLSAAQLQDLPSGPTTDDRDDARELALLLAEEDAAIGDYGQALRALDAAAALTGGVLPEEWMRRRAKWLAVR
ncbi:MAG TPA: FAD-dependent oxidoreductase [Solirubrobacter sp.]|nr:FAD-dependent oxidoreductase [Solirubrobacter sp.]